MDVNVVCHGVSWCVTFAPGTSKERGSRGMWHHLSLDLGDGWRHLQPTTRYWRIELFFFGQNKLISSAPWRPCRQSQRCPKRRKRHSKRRRFETFGQSLPIFCPGGGDDSILRGSLSLVDSILMRTELNWCLQADSCVSALRALRKKYREVRTDMRKKFDVCKPENSASEKMFLSFPQWLYRYKIHSRCA